MTPEQLGDLETLLARHARRGQHRDAHLIAERVPALLASLKETHATACTQADRIRELEALTPADEAETALVAQRRLAERDALISHLQQKNTELTNDQSQHIRTLAMVRALCDRYPGGISGSDLAALIDQSSADEEFESEWGSGLCEEARKHAARFHNRAGGEKQ